MNKVSKFTIYLIIFLLFASMQNLFAQENQDIRIVVKSRDSITPYSTDVGPINLRINLRIENIGQRDIYLFGSKYEGDFDPFFYLLKLDEKQKEWVFPTPSKKPPEWQTVSDTDKKTYRLQKGESFDFYLIFYEGTIKKTHKVALFYGYSKKANPILGYSEEIPVGKNQ